MSTPEGEAMVAEFRWVHDLLRRELAAVRELADRVRDGLDAEQARTEIAALAADSPLWVLRLHCLNYCGFVHGHHGHEDADWFPVLRRHEPALEPVLDRLSREHRAIADQLAIIETHAEALVEDPDARARLALSLEELSGALLAHLDYEEDGIFPALRTMPDPRRR